MRGLRSIVDATKAEPSRESGVRRGCDIGLECGSGVASDNPGHPIRAKRKERQMSTKKLITLVVASAALAGFAGATLGQDAKARYEDSRAGQAAAALFANNPYWYNKPGWRPGDSQLATEKQLPTFAKDVKAPNEKSRAEQAGADTMRGAYHLQDKHNP